ncbi:hypothetical protein MCUN1_003730 [Malassezia cuniculi]|uniref:Uncharacterized protein n=1 Tax=Malassezia cuniculi TaxID=948313 RepID=A0AAF0J881_9BASI|nr:hypothetical protein MCUN1_003730 [Malassezia cuniculi]
MAGETAELSLVARNSKCGPFGDVVYGIEVAIQKLLPILTPILLVLGVGEIAPIIQLVVGVLEIVHTFC